MGHTVQKRGGVQRRAGHCDSRTLRCAGISSPCLFLMFKDSPQLYQSARIESNDSNVVSFEVNQTILLSVAMLRNRTKAHNILVIGCGGGAVPLGYSTLCPNATIDVVDLSKEVIDVASKYFGISEAKNVRTHVYDGVKYVKDRVLSTSLNILVVDVAAHDAVDGDELEMPPRTFVSLEFLTHARRVLKTGGLLLMNVIAKREMLKTVSTRLRKYFENVKIFGLDPNYIFFVVSVMMTFSISIITIYFVSTRYRNLPVVPEILDVSGQTVIF